jgi:EAL domain-containing protein (putative c-di-GMP-specific phosphodiesterase class I)
MTRPPRPPGVAPGAPNVHLARDDAATPSASWWRGPAVTPAVPRLTADELARAIASEAVVTRYQPKVRISDRVPVGVETLARLRHPRLGLLAPEQFVPLAESAGLAPQLTAAVTRRAVADIAAVREAGLKITVALNFPLEILALAAIPALLAQDVADAGLTPDCVIVELTESQVRDDLSVVRRVTDALRSRGFGLSIDDYGVGGAQARHLLELPFTEMKIDRSLVAGAITDPGLRTALETAAVIGRALKLTVVAEGVETPAIWDMLAGLPIDEAQGWMVGRPMPPGELAGWAAAWMGAA